MAAGINVYNPDLDPALLAGFAAAQGGNALVGAGGYLPPGYQTGANQSAGGSGGTPATGITTPTPTTGADGSTSFPNYVKATKPAGMATSAPANPKPGDQYWDEATGMVKVFDGSSAAWTTQPGGGSSKAADPNQVNTTMTLPSGETTQLTPDETAAQRALQNDVAAGQQDLSGAKATQSQIGNDLASAFAQLLGQQQQQTAATVAGIQNQGGDLTSQIAAEQATFAKSQADLVQQMQDATASQSKAMADLVTQLNQTTNQTAQKAKAPNYARAMAQNKALNGSGLSSTMLTGPGGVDPGALTLGRTSLLGAGA